MKMLSLIILLFLFLSIPLEAQWYCWGQKYGWGCRRYMDPTLADYDGNYYGYIDNINYPDTYHLPLNCQFNYCPPCPNNIYNYQYLKNCIHYTNQQKKELP